MNDKPSTTRHATGQPTYNADGSVNWPTYNPDGTVKTGRTRVMASAALVTQDQVHQVTNRRTPWQDEAWERYDDVPELRFGLDWLADACSRVRLYAGEVDRDGSRVPQAVDEKDAGAEQLLAPLDELFNQGTGQSEMLNRWITHLGVPGESFLAGFTDPGTKDRRWVVASSDEIKTGIDGTPEVHLPERMAWAPIGIGRTGVDAGTLIRLWRPHARRAVDPDSELIALRGVLRSIIQLGAHINASSDSRLAGAGILGIPDELVAAGQGDPSEGTANPIHGHPLVKALLEATVAPLKDRGLASAVAPLILTGPAEAVQALRHITFATPFDERVGALLDLAVRRMATGLSIPAEIVLGMSNGNHWNSFLIKDEAISVAVSPRVELLCEALTHQWYRPLLKASGVPDPDRWAIGYDVSALSQRPDRSTEAKAAHAVDVLSDEALVREYGFDVADMPTTEERRRRFLERVVLAHSNLAPALLPELGIPVPESLTQPTGTGGQPGRARLDRDPAAADTATDAPTDRPGLPGPPPAATGEAPSPPGRPRLVAAAADTDEGNDVDTAPPTAAADPVDDDQDPEQPAAAAAADGNLLPAQRTDPDPLLAAAAAEAEEWRTSCLEVGAIRALERSGMWLLNSYGRAQRGQLRDVPLAEIHTKLNAQDNWHDVMLAGAYRELSKALPDRPCMVDTVDRYVRALLTAGIPHEREYLAVALQQLEEAGGCDDAAA